jgi:hypothetical protein
MSREIFGGDLGFHAADSFQGIWTGIDNYVPGNSQVFEQAGKYIATPLVPLVDGQSSYPGMDSTSILGQFDAPIIFTSLDPGISNYYNPGALRDMPNISDLGKFKSLEDAQHYLTTIKIASVLSNMTVNLLIEIIKMLNGTKEFGIHPFKELGDFCKKNNLEMGLLDSNKNVVVQGSSEGNVYGLTREQTPGPRGSDTFIALYGDALDEASSKYNSGLKSDILKFIDKNSNIQLDNGMNGTPTSIKEYHGFGIDQKRQAILVPPEKYSGVTVGLPSFYRIVATQKTNRIG